MLMTRKIFCFSLAMAFLAIVATPDSAFARKKKQSKASKQANETADDAMYKPVDYVNKETPGPSLVVIPGQIKSSNASFAQKVTANNIADFAELELSMANFTVLERADLGPMLEELSLAANMGDTASLKKFKKGKFETTRWFLKLDILKAEQVAQVKKGFKGRTLGRIASVAIGGRGGAAAGEAVGSVDTSTEVGIWLIGMRYKILDATTTQQVATGYKELKMEIGVKSKSILGVERGEATMVGLDTMTQRLVQGIVAEMDKNNK